MEITLIIMAGLTAMTVLASVFSYLTERNKRKGPIDLKRLEELEARAKALEEGLEDKDSRLVELEGEVAFFKKLLEDKRS